VKVTLIARTAFNSEIAYDLTGWEGNARDTDAALLTEFAGRACYQSWKKPNPATADNEEYLKHIIEVNHGSVFEHGTATFYVEGVSRTLTHELIRHRHISPSQLSQRYVKLDADTRPVVPPLYRQHWTLETDPEATETQGIVERVWADAVRAYNELVDIWEARLYRRGVTGTQLKKQAREAARCVLPNMTPTAIVISANHRTWRHFLTLRGSLDADAEIRDLAIAVYDWLKEIEPAIYNDFMTLVAPDGRMYVNGLADVKNP
jgi:thymidylate synthase (FAD)